MNETMRAWAAGFFEGEGCIGNHAGTARSLQLNVVNTDLERLELFRDVVGVGTIRRRRDREGAKPIYVWQAFGAKAIAAYWLLEPWLGHRRRARFDEVAAIRQAHVDAVTAERACEGCGTRFRPSFGTMSAQQRFCEPNCGDRSRYRRRRARIAA